jgi:hypothetical protein
LKIGFETWCKLTKTGTKLNETGVKLTKTEENRSGLKVGGFEAKSQMAFVGESGIGIVVALRQCFWGGVAVTDLLIWRAFLVVVDGNLKILQRIGFLGLL